MPSHARIEGPPGMCAGDGRTSRFMDAGGALPLSPATHLRPWWRVSVTFPPPRKDEGRCRPTRWSHHGARGASSRRRGGSWCRATGRMPAPRCRTTFEQHRPGRGRCLQSDPVDAAVPPAPGCGTQADGTRCRLAVVSRRGKGRTLGPAWSGHHDVVCRSNGTAASKMRPHRASGFPVPLAGVPAEGRASPPSTVIGGWGCS